MGDQLTTGGFGKGSGALALRSVRDFGATGNGVTDDSGAFQRAFNAIAGVGGGVFVPPGNYLIASPLVMPSNLRVEGSPGATMIFSLTALQYALSAFQTFGGSTTVSTSNTPGTNTVQITSLSVTSGPIALGSPVVLSAGPGSPLNLRCSTYIVKNISGAGPFTLTLDRPILGSYTTGNGATCALVTSYPQNIIWNGNGMRFTIAAGAHALRFWEVLGSNACILRDVTMDEGGGTLANDYACSYDVGGWRNMFERLTVTVTSPQACLVFEGQDGSTMRDCRAVGAVSAAALLLQDCTACTVDSCAGAEAPTGLSIGSDGSNMGSLGTIVQGGSFLDNSSYGIVVFQGSADTNIVGPICQYNGIAGLYLSASGAASVRTTFSGKFTHNVTGILVDSTVTGSVGAGVDLSNNTGTVNGTALQAGTGTDVTLSGVVAKGLGNYGFISGGTLTMSDFEIQSSTASEFLVSNINTTGPAPSRFRLLNGHIQMDGNGSAGVLLEQPGSGVCVAYLTQVKMDGAGTGTSGVAVNTGCVARLGEGVDMSGTATPINLAGSGVCNRKGTVVANGASGVPVGFVDINAQDVVQFTLRTIGGTVGHPKYTITPGTGFSLTSDASDTSTYEWMIPS